MAAYSTPTIATGARHYSNTQAVRRAKAALPTMPDPLSGQRTYGNRGGVTPKQYRKFEKKLGYLPGVGASLQPKGWNIAMAAHLGMQGPKPRVGPTVDIQELGTFLTPRVDARTRLQRERDEQEARNETMLGGRARLT